MDTSIPHTAAEWHAFYMANRPDLSHLPPVVAANVHAKAWADFREAKISKGLWIGPGAAERNN